jgi:ActR/RegA family two-component response regulator
LYGQESDVYATTSPEEGLAILQNRGPFCRSGRGLDHAVDDGIQFLSRTREIAPDTVRLALTGHADIEAAITAVNEVNIFRFFVKPCARSALLKGLRDAIHQHRLVTAEKELLNQTLRGAIQVLIEVLGMVNPAAFSQSVRIRRYVQHIVRDLHLEEPWRYQLAALMSQLGCVNLDPEIVEAAYQGAELSPEDAARFHRHPAMARELVSQIPRLEAVAWMIAHQNDALGNTLEKQAGERNEVDIISLGAQLLKTALTLDRALMRGSTIDAACAEMIGHPEQYDTGLPRSLRGLLPRANEAEKRLCTISELREGMVLQEDLRTAGWVLVGTKGQEVTVSLISRLENCHAKKTIADSVLVLQPRLAKDRQTDWEAVAKQSSG